MIIAGTINHMKKTALKMGGSGSELPIDGYLHQLLFFFFLIGKMFCFWVSAELVFSAHLALPLHGGTVKSSPHREEGFTDARSLPFQLARFDLNKRVQDQMS